MEQLSSRRCGIRRPRMAPSGVAQPLMLLTLLLGALAACDNGGHEATLVQIPPAGAEEAIRRTLPVDPRADLIPIARASRPDVAVAMPTPPCTHFVDRNVG